MTEISVVIPVYGCVGCLKQLHARLTIALAGIEAPYEIIMVDDRSIDGSWDVLRELAAADPHLQALRLSRNFGQHAAITAGLTHARGAWTVVMDCDLQEPPEEIPRLYAKAQEGYDVVRTSRDERRHPVLRRAASRIYRAVLQHPGGVRVDLSTLSIVSRKVVDAFLSLPERDREYQLMLDWLGFSQAVMPFQHEQRGDTARSAYGLRELLSVAADGVFFRTTALLRFIVLIGFLIAAAGLLLAGYFIYSRYVTATPPGYTSVVVLITVLSGFIIISTGIVGLYIGRIFEEVKGRPLYVVDEHLESRPGG